MKPEMSDNDLVVVTYHVEERVNMAFAKNITTYEVSNVSLINSYDLGPNNTRVVTPKYSTVRKKVKPSTVVTMNAPVMESVATNSELPTGLVDTTTVKPKVSKPEPKGPQTAFIDILETYERVLEKGYISTDMLRKVANKRFFSGDLNVAEKWYSKLFAITTDFEPVHFYRYAQALKAVGKIDKSNEMMAIFKKKDLESEKAKIK